MNHQPIKITLKVAKKYVKNCPDCKNILKLAKNADKEYVWLFQIDYDGSYHIESTRAKARLLV